MLHDKRLEVTKTPQPQEMEQAILGAYR